MYEALHSTGDEQGLTDEFVERYEGHALKLLKGISADQRSIAQDVFERQRLGDAVARLRDPNLMRLGLGATESTQATPTQA